MADRLGVFTSVNKIINICVSDTSCVDTIGSAYTIGGVDVTCAGLQKDYVHFCSNEDVQSKCCASCKTVMDAKNQAQGMNNPPADLVESEVIFQNKYSLKCEISTDRLN